MGLLLLPSQASHLPGYALVCAPQAFPATKLSVHCAGLAVSRHFLQPCSLLFLHHTQVPGLTVPGPLFLMCPLTELKSSGQELICLHSQLYRGLKSPSQTVYSLNPFWNVTFWSVLLRPQHAMLTTGLEDVRNTVLTELEGRRLGCMLFPSILCFGYGQTSTQASLLAVLTFCFFGQDLST